MCPTGYVAVKIATACKRKGQQGHCGLQKGPQSLPSTCHGADPATTGDKHWLAAGQQLAGHPKSGSSEPGERLQDLEHVDSTRNRARALAGETKAAPHTARSQNHHSFHAARCNPLVSPWDQESFPLWPPACTPCLPSVHAGKPPAALPPLLACFCAKKFLS